MTELPVGFELGKGAYCFPEGMSYAARFSYIPGAPRVDIPPFAAGRPAAGLTDSDDAAVISIQAVWDISDEEKTELAAKISQLYPDAKNWPVGMTQFSSVTASLVIGNGSSAKTVGPQQSSGMEPYGAVIQATLTKEEKASAVEAFDGASEALSLIYQASFDLREQVKVLIKGDLAAALKALAPTPETTTDDDDDGGGGWFNRHKKPKKTTPPPMKEPATMADCRAQVDDAIASGDLAETFEETPNVSDALKKVVSTKLREMIAKKLFETLEQLGANAGAMTKYGINQSQSDSETKSYSVERHADLGEWFAANNGASLVSQSPNPIAAP